MESLIVPIFALSIAMNLVFGFFVYLFRHKIYAEIGEEMQQGLVAWFSQPENQEAIAKNVQNLVVEPLKMAALGQLGGISKGINSQLRGLEREIVADGIDQATGLPIGALAAKYLDKYPILKMALPFVLKGKQVENRGWDEAQKW